MEGERGRGGEGCVMLCSPVESASNLPNDESDTMQSDSVKSKFLRSSGRAEIESLLALLSLEGREQAAATKRAVKVRLV